MKDKFNEILENEFYYDYESLIIKIEKVLLETVKVKQVVNDLKVYNPRIKTLKRLKRALKNRGNMRENRIVGKELTKEIKTQRLTNYFERIKTLNRRKNLYSTEWWNWIKCNVKKTVIDQTDDFPTEDQLITY